MIRDCQLYLQELKLCIEEAHVAFISAQFSENLSIEYTQRLQFGKTLIKSEIAILRYKELQLKLGYSGDIRGHQGYVDEAYITDKGVAIGSLHEEECKFYFNRGILDIDNSNIFKRSDTYISKWTWNGKYLEEQQKSD